MHQRNIENFNKTDEHNVFSKSVESRKSDNKKSDIFLGTESEETESDGLEPSNDVNPNEKLDN